jgi:hypothetical protein
MTVLKNDKDGPVWLFLRKRGKLFKDDISIVLENFVRTDAEHPDEGQALRFVAQRLRAAVVRLQLHL